MLRRIAVRIAEISWPDVDLGEEDLQAIEGYVTMFGSDGVSWVRHVYPWAPSPDLKAMLDDRRRWLYEVTPTQTKRLYGIAERQWQANPYYRPPRYQAQQPPTVVIVGEID